jgi:hypothetical protein
VWLILGTTLIAGSTLVKSHAGSSQAADVQGQVDRFTLSCDGTVDGFLLVDGTEVHVAPSLATQIGDVLQHGEPVRVQGMQVPGVRVVTALSVTNENTQEVVIDTGEEGSPNSPTPAVAGAAEAAAEGVVMQLLHGLEGQVDGALLDDGLLVRLPPNAPLARADLFVVGRKLAVRGEAFETAHGRVIRIDRIGGSQDELGPMRQTGTEQPQAPLP